jgi:hypothetical protein
VVSEGRHSEGCAGMAGCSEISELSSLSQRKSKRRKTVDVEDDARGTKVGRGWL